MRVTKCISGAVAALAAVIASILPATGFAQDAYPSRPITIVVPFAAGGVTDYMGRLIGKKMGEYLKQSVVIENVPGASTMIGAERVAHAANDGYTLLVGSSTTFSTNPHLFKNIRYSIDDFAPISVVARQPFAVDMNKDIPAKTVSELIEFAKKQKDGLNYGTTGTGGVSHLIGAMMEMSMKIPMRQIPYKGSSPAMTDLLAGHIHLYFDAITTSLPLHRDGKIKILAVTGSKRSPAAPEIPTLVESGYKDLVLEFRQFLVAPKDTPQAIINKLNEAARFALADPEVLKRLEQDAAVPEPLSPADSMKVMKGENANMGRIIRMLNISIN